MIEETMELQEPAVPWTTEEWQRASRYTYRVWWSLEDGLYLAQCVEMPLAMSHGGTPEEAIHNAIDAAAVHLDTLEGERVPDADSTIFVTAEVAEMLGISVRRVQALAESRHVGTKRGRDLLFSESDIAAMRERRPGRPVARKVPAV